MNEATFGSDDSFMTVGEMSSTTIDNCVLYSAPERHELSMAFNFHMLLDQGKSPEQAFKIIQAKSRDNSRTPMQWDASDNAGFSIGTPWLKAGKSYKDINVENEINGPIFTFYKELIRLRKEMPIISEGSYQPALEDSQQVYAFERHLDGQKLLVLNNFYGSETEVEIPEEY